LAEAGMEPSVGSVGDSYDNALAESVIGLFKTEVIRRRGPWRGLEDVEFATLDWVSWYNTQRLLEPGTFHRSSIQSPSCCSAGRSVAAPTLETKQD
jgi:transposase InsO family protein